MKTNHSRNIFASAAMIVFVLIAPAVVGGLSNGVVAYGQSPAEQEQLKSDYMRQISEFIHHYDKTQMFAKWMSLGDTAKFRARLNQPGITIEVNPNISACAQYDPANGVLSIQKHPNAFTFSILTSGDSSLLLWHEAVHAISHGHQSGAIKPSRPFKGVPTKIAPTSSGKLPVEVNTNTTKPMTTMESMTTSAHQTYTTWAGGAVDHLYLNWAESCVEGTQALTMLEKRLKKYGKAKPPDDVKAATRRYWKKFVDATNSSIFGQVPNAEERRELEKMTGFRCDPSEILSGYLSLGYPMDYFGDYVTDEQVWKLFPTPEQLGTTGMKVRREVTTCENISRNYILNYTAGPPGRVLTIHLSLYGSPKLSKIVWDAVGKLPGKQKRTHLPKVGQAGYVVSTTNNNSDHLVAIFWNAHVLMTDVNVTGSLETGDLGIQRRALRPQIVQKLFKNIEALESPPIPPGVMTSVPKN